MGNVSLRAKNRQTHKRAAKVSTLTEELYKLKSKKNRTVTDNKNIISLNYKLDKAYSALKEAKKVDDQLVKLQSQGPVKRARKSVGTRKRKKVEKDKQGNTYW